MLSCRTWTKSKQAGWAVRHGRWPRLLHPAPTASWVGVHVPAHSPKCYGARTQPCNGHFTSLPHASRVKCSVTSVCPTPSIFATWLDGHRASSLLGYAVPCVKCCGWPRGYKSTPCTPEKQNKQNRQTSHHKTVQYRLCRATVELCSTTK